MAMSADSAVVASNHLAEYGAGSARIIQEEGCNVPDKIVVSEHGKVA
jgi:hypothetical protein